MEQSWDEYVRSNILEFRRFYKLSYDQENQKHKQDPFTPRILLNEPCQIVVVDLAETLEKYVIILHQRDRQDMETEIIPQVAFEDSYEEFKKTKLLQAISPKSIIEIAKFLILTHSRPYDLQKYWTIFPEGAIFYFETDPRIKGQNHISDYIHQLIAQRTYLKK